MAILFYEGLPRSGKSYEAMSTLVIPWLLKGREVVAYIEGLDTDECKQRIAEASGLPLERIEELLFPLTREDMRPREVERNGKKLMIDGTWIEKTRDNALHVFDEAQNWWPNRMKATEEITQFVTEHGHRGITILLMGQSLLDVLALWRRRVDQKFVFLKLTALGADKRYRVTIHKGQGNGEFVKVADKLNKYDPKYFGTYRSHVSGDIDTDTYTDDRIVFWKGGMVKYGAVFAIACLVFGSWKLWAFFHPKEPATVAVAAKPGSVSAAKAIAPAPTGPAASPTVAKPQVEAAPPVDLRSPEERYFSDLGTKGRVRLSGLMVFKGKTAGVVEWLDGNTRVIERIGIDTLQQLGVTVQVIGPSVKLSLGGWNALATMWPVEAEGRVSDYRQATMRPAADGGLPPSQAEPRGERYSVASPAGLSIIDGATAGSSVPVAAVAGESARPRVPTGSKWSFQSGG
ncbi:zonular occludens toxin domain-containing protein [Variovorax paradoxus]|uniref:zonular occludens toxin family protein n=1 Tax=Variovorax paradoxus TaxID=34073 RepID=UPI000371DF55|nr:zonular occludens toxin domain-containing protein [Variovorax paradoxus]